MCWSHHGHVRLEDLLDELVLGRVDELDDVGVEAVPVFLQEPWRKIGGMKNCQVTFDQKIKKIVF